jgi:hypothetical protein
MVSTALALAASLLVVAGIVVWQQAQGPEPIARRPQAKKPAQAQQATRPAVPIVAPAPRPPELVRDPTLLEQVVLAGRFPRAKPARIAARKPPRGPASLADLVAAAAAGDVFALSVRVGQLRVDPERHEAQLAAVARAPDNAWRLPAARLLARLGTPRSLVALADLVADPLTAPAALEGLARLATSRDLARRAAAEPNPRHRISLIAALLARRSDDSTALYLALVDDRRTRPEALAAVGRLADPPSEPLLRFLESPRGAQRLAAAQALSRVPDPAVAERLCQALGGIGRQEALVALLLSTSDQAARCLDHARTDIYLVAAVHAAEQQLHHLGIKGGNLP